MAFLSDVDAGDAGDSDDEGGAADDDGDDDDGWCDFLAGNCSSVLRMDTFLPQIEAKRDFGSTKRDFAKYHVLIAGLCYIRF